jgi:hypothetical protein
LLQSKLKGFKANGKVENGKASAILHFKGQRFWEGRG